LGENEDAAQAGVDAVGKRDVDDAVDAAEDHGGFGAIASERVEALTGASSEQDSERIFHSHTLGMQGATRTLSWVKAKY